MTLEQLGFVEERINNRVLFNRPQIFDSYREYIEFNLTYKEIEITNIFSIDMMLLEAVYNKAKELFIWLKNIKKY